MDTIFAKDRSSVEYGGDRSIDVLKNNAVGLSHSSEAQNNWVQRRFEIGVDL